jgi:outer membrane receptor protein involved in Fe transport
VLHVSRLPRPVPSSALYGGGAIGATVNLIRKKPSAQRAHDVSASAEAWGLGRGTLGATGRWTENALYRLNLGVETRNGLEAQRDQPPAGDTVDRLAPDRPRSAERLLRSLVLGRWARSLVLVIGLGRWSRSLVPMGAVVSRWSLGASQGLAVGLGHWCRWSATRRESRSGILAG